MEKDCLLRANQNIKILLHGCIALQNLLIAIYTLELRGGILRLSPDSLSYCLSFVIF